ncbi:unnamed protein product [Closterium sp. NIES-54]
MAAQPSPRTMPCHSSPSNLSCPSPWQPYSTIPAHSRAWRAWPARPRPLTPHATPMPLAMAPHAQALTSMASLASTATTTMPTPSCRVVVVGRTSLAFCTTRAVPRAITPPPAPPALLASRLACRHPAPRNSPRARPGSGDESRGEGRRD